MNDNILVIGANGQIGTELVEELRKIHGDSNVIATDLKDANAALIDKGPYMKVDVLDTSTIASIIDKHKITQVYLLAALLSATAEQKVRSAWRLNMDGLLGLLDLAAVKKFKLFWPSSIAVFGPTTPRQNVPQHTIMEPTTVYGISKLAGERWCEYYFNRFGVDVRSIRYPGLIGYKSNPGGGTTDYAVHIYHEALKHHSYECFLSANTSLPMMYMPDALRATIGLMEAPAQKIKERGSYNLSGMSFTPDEIYRSIKKHLPDFTITYKPDQRQAIADSWPQSISDTVARQQWGWQHQYDLEKMTEDMLKHIGDLASAG